MDKLWELLESSIGKRLSLLILIFVAGGVLVWTAPQYVMLASEKDIIITAMNQGDAYNEVAIINLQLDNARTEKLKLQNFIDFKQDGKCNDSQRQRLEELNATIQRLEIRREEVFRTLKK